MPRLAIIPARGGSKRIKNKNIRDFCGKPIISYIINTAIESQLFDKIHVSTESELIKNVVEQYSISFDFMRPEYLADDFTPLMPVLSYVLKKYESMNLYFDEIWLLMACAPLIESKDLISASKLFANQEKKIQSILAVSEFAVPIEWAFLRTESGDLKPRYSGKFSVRSQDLPISYFDTGTFTIFPRKNILEANYVGTDEDYLGFILPKFKSIDIDSEEDWFIAESIYSHTRKIKSSDTH
tara:strand:+ start:2466 stop:3185 length:720 start_codon:yes stop_codon:yes gene_type:complete